MSKLKSFLNKFKQSRHAGDVVFSSLFLAFSVFLTSQIGEQITWLKGVKLFVQPGFWSVLSLIGMTMFALFYFLGSVLSYREHRNLKEVVLWLQSFEYALWFLAYVWIVPIIGYLLGTLLFVGLLTLRTGYRETKFFVLAGAIGIAIVVIFKGFLTVKIPGGHIYQFLPDTIRSFMSLYL